MPVSDAVRYLIPDTRKHSFRAANARLLSLWLVACGLWVVLSGCGTPPTAKDVVDLIPLDNEISGWNRSGAMQVAENSQQLYDLIDGEGQPYIDNGFVKSAFQKFSGRVGQNTVELELRIFDQADTANARKAYEAITTGSEVPWTDNPAGSAARVEQSLFAYKLDYWGDRFCVWITIQDNTDQGLAVAKVFARNVWAAILE